MTNPGSRYEVRLSAAVAERIRQIQRRAKTQGRGDKVIAALTEIHQRLQSAPREFGEPLYRLSALKLEVRTVAIRPIVVDFAVHEDQLLVFVKGVKLLTEFTLS